MHMIVKMCAQDDPEVNIYTFKGHCVHKKEKLLLGHISSVLNVFYCVYFLPIKIRFSPFLNKRNKLQ